MTETQQFRVKPTLVEVVQWTHPDQGHAIAEWAGGDYDPRTAGGVGPAGEDWGDLTIDTREGTVTVSPYSPAVFSLTHEPAPAPPTTTTTTE
ncbi:hypothetical protein H7I77_09760 [Mycolicibacterium novocastrense]|uniref:Uncharacterized protein n=1 Tax=Mycolicibacterium novocastrense TaxID=59813 RepID=A0AAW5SJQ8_MYCNV|nr:hypothetical protein [Mycolicibacterium novocastrense]MCV7023631.1 hypothetical protein [Mycolicibacterium novocastrense]